jgi:hypothetical protein
VWQAVTTSGSYSLTLLVFVTELEVPDHHVILDRRVLRKPAHPLIGDPGLVPGGGPERHRRARDRQQVVKADLRRQRSLQIASREDRVHLPLGPEVRPRDLPFMRLELLVDQLTKPQQPPLAGLHRDLRRRLGDHRAPTARSRFCEPPCL